MTFHVLAAAGCTHRGSTLTHKISESRACERVVLRAGGSSGRTALVQQLQLGMTALAHSVNERTNKAAGLWDDDSPGCPCIFLKRQTLPILLL